MVALRTRMLFSVAAISLIGAGCDDKVLPIRAVVPEDSLHDLMEQEGLTEFLALSELTGLHPAFDTGASSLTVFAPTNQALAALPADVKSDPDALATYLNFHVTGGYVDSKLLGFSDSVRTSAGGYMGVEGDATITLSGAEGSQARITKPDLRANNGILHVIDAVLTPTEPPGPGTVVEIATELGFESFVSAVMSARLDDDLSAEGAVFNVLAPNEAAFMEFTAPASADILANILLHHVVLGDVATASITEGAELPTAAGTTIVVPALGATVVAETNNGTLTEVTAVSLPPTTLEYLEDNTDTSSLSAAIEAAGLTMDLDPDTLGDGEPVTLFAPINSAFTSSVAPGDLEDLLLRHVVAGHVPTSSLTDGLDLMSENGTITVEVDGSGTITVSDGDDTATVRGEIRTLTGVVHLIDGVLTP